MRRIWSVLLGSLLLTAPAAVQAQFKYTTNAGAIIITNYSGPPWAVVIPAMTNNLPVTGIGNGAFERATSMTSVAIPDSVNSIGEFAFYGCTGLTNVVIPGSVTNIGKAAFEGCTGLTNATISNGVISIGIGVFSYCPNLTNVTIPGSVTSIGNDAFGYCTGLKAIEVDALNLFYSSTNGVLLDNSRTTLVTFPIGLGGSYTIPGGITSIGEEAFANCFNLTSVTIPVSVTNLGDYAFEGCSGLSSIMIPGSVSSIGDYEFAGCSSLTNVTIPGSVSSIGSSAFQGCSSLGGVTIPGSVTTIGDGAFNESGLTNVMIPSSVVNISDQEFFDCPGLINVTIPAGVTSIGSQSFAYCYALAGVYFKGNAPTVGSDGFQGDSATVYYLPGTVGWGAFSSNTGRTTVLWNPGIQAGGAGFGVQNQQFGFNITNTANLTVVVEVCTNLASPVWFPLQTVTLTNGSYHFSEPGQGSRFGRYYGLGLP